MANAKSLVMDKRPSYPRSETYTCHLRHSKGDLCKNTAEVIRPRPIFEKFLNDLKLKSEAEQQIKQLELIQDLYSKLREAIEIFRKKFQNWSKCRLETIEELSKCIGTVKKVKQGTNVVTSCGQISGVLSGIVDMGETILAPTGILYLAAVATSVSLGFTSKILTDGATIVDRVSAYFQSRRVVSLIKSDREQTEQMADAVESMISTNEDFIQAVDEFQRRNQLFNIEAFTEFKALDKILAIAAAYLFKSLETAALKSVGVPIGFLKGIHVLMDTLDLIQTVKDIQDGSKSQLQEDIMALTDVLNREHGILKKYYDSSSTYSI